MRRVLFVTSAILACLLGAWESAFGGSPNPYMWISKVTIDTVSLTTPSRVTVEVAGGSRGGLTPVSAWIDSGQGYKIVSQPTARTDTLRRGNTFSLVGVIQATAKGSWCIQVEAKGMLRDGTVVTGKDEVYIQLTDTLNRALSATDYILLPHEKRMKRQGVKPDSIIYTPGLKQAKPKPRENMKQVKPNSDGKSGTFNLIGSSYWHDPRDGVGTYQPEVNVTIEVWNCNRFDSPPSDDALLGTAVTDGYGCFSFWWLDNS
jgi:hypothetical protein